MSPVRLTILISGNQFCHSSKYRSTDLSLEGHGTNLQAIIDACQNQIIPDTTIVKVISNREKAYGLERAKNAGIPTAIVKYV